MNQNELRQWLMSEEGLLGEIATLRRWSARQSFGSDVVRKPEHENGYAPDWQRLLLAASILAESAQRSEQEVSLMISQAALLFGDRALVRDSAAVVLSQLANKRSVELATKREFIAPDLQSRLGISERLLTARRELETAIAVNARNFIDGNEFQSELWLKLLDADWTSATAPTAAGKTFLVLNWLLQELERSRAKLIVFLAPTRALVGEIEKQVLDFLPRFEIPDIRVASLPLKGLGDLSKPTVLVLTQERLHLFMNACDAPPQIDIAVVDEAQKLNDGGRGVILQDAIERIVRANEACRFVYLSPHAANPETLLDDAPPESSTAIIPGSTPTITQNLVLATQRFRKPTEWILKLAGDDFPVGEFRLHAKTGTTDSKRLSFIALALGRYETGTLVYANGAAEAEKIAQQIYDGIGALEDIDGSELDEELKDLSDFCRSSIHSRFQLVSLVKRGVAFHYGNMPTILRNEIERLFRNGKIRFLVCTSTLVEGVNLACRTIIMRGPKKGMGNHMTPQDFWNLAGRAGRWGADFHGNIVCVDPANEQLWPSGVPEKSAYPIERETENVLREATSLAKYIAERSQDAKPVFDEGRESVSAYLMAWQTRNGSILNAPSVQRSSSDGLRELEQVIAEGLSGIEVPEEVINAHPGITALAMQSLLNDFKAQAGPTDAMLPPYPGDENFVGLLKDVFARIDRTLAPAFRGENLQWSAAFTTRDWIQGKKLGFMISGAIEREREKLDGDEVNYAAIIRGTMKFVEEFARFKAPKFLAAYIDILRFHFEQKGEAEKFPRDLPFDLYLEFGVSTSSLLALIGLGLSRTSAIELNEFLGRDDMAEEDAISYLRSQEWENFDLPKLVKREIRELVERRNRIGTNVA